MFISTDKKAHVADAWKSFRADLLAPYKASYYRQNIEEWFETLQTRQRAGEDIRLSSFNMTNNLKQSSSFHAWGINSQMFISPDPRVLTIPYPQKRSACVGIWLNDFSKENSRPWFDWVENKLTGAAPDFLASFGEGFFYDTEYKAGDTYVRDVCNTIRSCVLVPQGASTRHPFWNTSIRLAKLMPSNVENHHDGADAGKWGRVIIHSFRGTGTIYVLDGSHSLESIDVPMPTGTTSCHLETGRYEAATNDYWGAITHRAGADRDGRGVIILEGTEALLPPETTQPPWASSPCAPALLSGSRLKWLRHILH